VVIGYGALFGLANGIGYGLSLHTISLECTRSRGTVTGMAVAGYAASSAVFAPVCAVLVNRFGIGAAFLSLALLMFLGAVAILWLWRGFVTYLGEQSAEADDSTSDLTLQALLVLWSSFFFAGAVGVLVLGHAAPLVASYGGTAQQAALAVSLVAIGNGIGRLTGAPLSERVASRWLLAFAPLANAGALGLLLLQPRVGIAFLAMFAVGIGYGLLASSMPIVIVKSAGAVRLARIYGRIFTAWGAAGLIAPVLGGALFDAFGNYAGVVAVGCIVSAAGAGTGFLYAGK
jgi:OFA family oxalate/formate antiporter-like MFS transporter